MKRMLWVAVPALIAVGCAGSSGPGEFIGGAPSTYRQVQDTIFTPSCATNGCHAGNTAPHGLDLTSSQALANLINVDSIELPLYDRISPGDATDSYLFMKVTGDGRIEGDPMPAFAPQLGADKLQLLQDWIEQGANP